MYFQRAIPPMTAILAFENSLIPFRIMITSAAALSRVLRDGDMMMEGYVSIELIEYIG